MLKKSMIVAGTVAALVAAIGGGLARAVPAIADTTSVVTHSTSVAGVEDGTNDGETADDGTVVDGVNDGEIADDQSVEDGTNDGETAD